MARLVTVHIYFEYQIKMGLSNTNLHRSKRRAKGDNGFENRANERQYYGYEVDEQVRKLDRRTGIA